MSKKKLIIIRFPRNENRTDSCRLSAAQRPKPHANSVNASCVWGKEKVLLLKEAGWSNSAYFMTAKTSRVYFDARVKYRAKRSSVVAQLGQSHIVVVEMVLWLFYVYHCCHRKNVFFKPRLWFCFFFP